MWSTLFPTPDRLIEAARVFECKGYERSFEVLRDTMPALRGAERPMRAVRAGCRSMVELAPLT